MSVTMSGADITGEDGAGGGGRQTVNKCRVRTVGKEKAKSSR